MQDVAQQLNISGCNSKKFMQQWIITCYWQRCRAELNMQFTFDSSQNKIQPDSTIYKGRKWWKKIPQHSKLSNDTVPWISSTIPSQKITGKKYKSKRVSVNAVIAHSYGCWSPKKFTLITWYSIEYLKDAQGHCWQLQLEWFLRTDYLLPNSH